jgi:hypothetical protein
VTAKPSEARNTREWDLGERYYSNGGKGPQVARILSWCDGVLTLERKMPRAKNWERFQLKERYWLSRSCGWRLR